MNKSYKSMKGKRGARMGVELVIVFAVLLVVVVVVVPFFTGKFSKGGEAISGVQESAITKLKTWDQLTEEEQEKVEKEDPAEAEESKIETAQEALDKRKYDLAINLAENIIKISTTTEGVTKARIILIKAIEEKEKKAEIEKRLQEEIERESDELLEARKKIIDNDTKKYDQELQEKYSLANKAFLAQDSRLITSLLLFKNTYNKGKVNRLFSNSLVLANFWHKSYSEVLIWLTSAYTNSKDCVSIEGLKNEVNSIKEPNSIINVEGYPEDLGTIYDYNLGICYINKDTPEYYAKAEKIFSFDFQVSSPSLNQEMEDLYYISLAKNPNRARKCNKLDVKETLCVQEPDDKRYYKLWGDDRISDSEYKRMVCYKTSSFLTFCERCDDWRKCSDYDVPDQAKAGRCLKICS